MSILKLGTPWFYCSKIIIYYQTTPSWVRHWASTWGKLLSAEARDTGAIAAIWHLKNKYMNKLRLGVGVWSIPPAGTIRNHVGRVCLETPLATFFTFCEISQRWLQQGARDILVTNNQELCDRKVVFWILRRYMTGKKKKNLLNR